MFSKKLRKDPVRDLKHLLEQMPQHLYDQEAEYMSDPMPWSQRYRCYEMKEKEDLVKAQASARE